MHNRIKTVGSLVVAMALCAAPGLAQLPDHPIITEVYNNPPGANDAPVGRDLGNAHQEFIEIYLPTAGDLNAGLNPNALNLTFYEIEGDSTSSGNALVNYRFDLPTFDVDLSNATAPGVIERPLSGVVVLGWVDYVGDPATGLAGTPSSRVALVNGGITGTAGQYVFIAINGHHFQGDAVPGGGGTTNFPTLLAESLIHLPNEARSGVLQNGAGAYLLVNRDALGYVELYDDKDTANVPSGTTTNADPDMAGGGVLGTSALMDGLAGNDHTDFDVFCQPFNGSPGDTELDLLAVLPEGGAFSILVPQIDEEVKGGQTPSLGGGYARRFVDVPKTTESAAVDDPVVDAINAYQLIRNNGPFYPTPGRVQLTTSVPELGVAVDAEQVFDVLTQTIAHTGLLTANMGGSTIDISASGGATSNSAVATFAAGVAATNVAGQSFAFPTMQIAVAPAALHGQTASATVTVTATGDPGTLNPIQTVTVTARVINPTTGQDVLGQPFETTVFVAIQGLVDDPGVANEFRSTDLGVFLAAQPSIVALETQGRGSALLDAATDLSDPLVVVPWIKEMPGDGEECVTWVNPLVAPGTLDLAQTILGSAESLTGAGTYDCSISICDNTAQTVVKAIRLNIPDTQTFGGTFTPSEQVNFVDAQGGVGQPRSGLTRATTTRTFEVALIDTAVKIFGVPESGDTDDFGIIIEVEQTEPGAPVVDGQYVFLSFTGGLQGADLDGLNVPPGSLITTIIYLDLDNLHDVLGIRTIESVYIINADSGEPDFIEAFSLNLAAPGLPFDNNVDGLVTLLDVSGFDGCLMGPQVLVSASCLVNDADGDFDVDAADASVFMRAVTTGP